VETRVISAKGKEVVIGDGLPTVLIGERINPFGKGPVKEAILSGNTEPIQREALAQVEAGADILILSVAAFGVDEVVTLPRVAAAVMEATDVPLCLESRNPAALEQTLRLGCGRPIISSITGEEALMSAILPLAKQYNTALVILASDESGIPNNAPRRVEVLRRIVDRAAQAGLAPEDLIADCVAESSAVNNNGALITLETMAAAKAQMGLNLVLGASNVSFGLPSRSVINAAFLSIAVHGGLNCAIVNAKLMKPYIMAADLLMGRDNRARRYTTYCRKLMKSASPR
jgi:5-methyltetrahydrofolate--homocysteine methyltransferase